MAGHRIDITDMKGFRIGNAGDYEGMTGVTVVLLDSENTAGIDISGGGPAARESALLFPTTSSHSLHAIVLSGGSAFGLDASSGVMQYLEERGRGYHIVKYRVPLVCQSCIFDLGIGKEGVRPNARMGYLACQDAERNQPASGIVGAGIGASVGKLYGIGRGTKSGIGYAAVQLGQLQVGAIALVNAYGDVRNPSTGQIIAGLRNPERTKYIDMVEEMMRLAETRSFPAEDGQKDDAGAEMLPEESGRANTTLAVILTNASFSKTDMNRIAAMARAGLGRCIAPVGTPADGDTIYAVSLQPGIEAQLAEVGTIAAQMLGEAILDAVTSSRMEEEVFLEKINQAKAYLPRPGVLPH